MPLVYAWLLGVWFGSGIERLNENGVKWPWHVLVIVSFMVVGYALLHAVIG